MFETIKNTRLSQKKTKRNATGFGQGLMQEWCINKCGNYNGVIDSYFHSLRMKWGAVNYHVVRTGKSKLFLFHEKKILSLKCQKIAFNQIQGSDWFTNFLLVSMIMRFQLHTK